MSNTLKTSGASCPKCNDSGPAEYAQMGQAPQWACHKCGAGGPLTGSFSGRSDVAAGKVTPTVKKHWRDK